MTKLELPDGMGPAEALRGLADDLLAPDAKLRAFVDFGREDRWDSGPLEGATHGGFLRLVADLIDRKTTRNPADDVTMSAYDLLPECDRKAISLALDCGGVEEIKKRLMPEGMEWPRFEDGEPLSFGCEYLNSKGNAATLRTVLIKDLRDVLGGDIFWRLGKGANAVELKNGERVKRPQAIASDGEPLEVGQTVYATHYDYVKCTVLAVEWVVDGYLVEVENESGHKFRQTPDEFTHQRPVLDADGVPCCIGDEVWDIHIGEHQVIKDITGTCGEYETLVVRLDSGEQTTCDAVRVSHRKPVLDAAGVPIKKGDTVYGTVEGGPFIVTEVSDKGSVFVDAFPGTGMHGSMFTHTKPEPPDSWERLDEDAEKNPFDYCKDVGHRLDTCENAERFKSRDIVRRCRALAERGGR